MVNLALQSGYHRTHILVVLDQKLSIDDPGVPVVLHQLEVEHLLGVLHLNRVGLHQVVLEQAHPLPVRAALEQLQLLVEGGVRRA